MWDIILLYTCKNLLTKKFLRKHSTNWRHWSRIVLFDGNNIGEDHSLMYLFNLCYRMAVHTCSILATVMGTATVQQRWRHCPNRLFISNYGDGGYHSSAKVATLSVLSLHQQLQWWGLHVPYGNNNDKRPRGFSVKHSYMWIQAAVPVSVSACLPWSPLV